MYVILEGVIEAMFPKNKFKELFRKLHSQSARLKTPTDTSQETCNKKQGGKS